MSPAQTSGIPSYSIASIPADGIGPEVIDAGITALQALADTLKTFKLDFTHYDWSSETYKKTGKYIPDGGLEQLKKHDAILFGAVGAPGKTCLYNVESQQEAYLNRRPRPHLPLGPTTSHLPASPTIRKRATYQGLSRHSIPSPQLRYGGPRLGHHPRKQRRRIRRSRRTFTPGSSLGNRH